MRFPTAAVTAVLALAVIAPVASAAPAFAESYREGFVEYWTRAFRRTDTMVLFVMLVGAVCIAIIMLGGKWKK